MRVIAAIPARLDSTRLPGKMLLNATGVPLVVHTYMAVATCPGIDSAVIVSSDRKIIETAQAYGAAVFRTVGLHPNGTSRLSEFSRRVGLNDDTCVINVQGDEPEVSHAALQVLIAGVQEAQPDVGTLVTECQSARDFTNPSIVKAVISGGHRAIWFCRSFVPMQGRVESSFQVVKHHIGVYAYSPKFLKLYASSSPCQIEKECGLEQLRAIDMGASVLAWSTDTHHRGIDTRHDYEEFVRRTVG